MVAVLPREDGSVVEIEGEYGARDRGREACHQVWLHDGNHELWVRSVKPLPVVEPEVFGACVIDRQGKRWIRVEQGYWRSEDRLMRGWRALLADFAPVRVVNADPWSES